MGRFLWTVLVLVQVLAPSESLREEWKPPNYSDTLSDAQKFLLDYNSTAEEVMFFSQSASWNYNTNITDDNSALQVGEHLELYLRRHTSSTSKCMDGQAFLFNRVQLVLTITPTHLSPEVQTQFISSAARSACVWMEVLAVVQMPSPSALASQGSCRLSYQLYFAISCLFWSLFGVGTELQLFKNSFQLTIRRKKWVSNAAVQMRHTIFQDHHPCKYLFSV